MQDPNSSTNQGSPAQTQGNKSVSEDPNPIPTTDITVTLESLPSPPFVAMEIIRLTRDPNSTAKHLANVLSQDPVIATRILKVANSPAYGLTQEVTGIERAIALLGLKAVEMMALSFSLVADVGSTPGALSVETYWYHSLLNAVSARRWAELTLPGLVEEAFLAGLLSHLGRLALAQQKSAEYAEMLSAHEVTWPSLEAETATFGFNAADVTADMMKAWELPPLIFEAATAMFDDHEPSSEVNGAAELAQVMRNVVATETALSPVATEADVEALHQAALEAGVDADWIVEFVADLETRVRDLADILDVSIPEGVSHQQLLTEARNRLVEVSLSAAHGLQTAQEEAMELQYTNQELSTIAYEDRLTKVPNRAAFDEHLARQVAGVVRFEAGSVGMRMLDGGPFKLFNATYGDQTGDEVLHAVAQAMSGVTRGDEFLARYGGEEFVLVAADCTSADMRVAGERLRKAVEDLTVSSHAGNLSVTISGGGAVMKEVGDRDADARLIKLADEALYQAKEAGRNQIRMHS